MNSKSIRVLYDIATCGEAQFNLLSRTGIFTVCKNISLGLAVSEKCDVTYSTMKWNHSYCEKYIKAEPVLSSQKFSKPSSITSGLENGVYRTNQKINMCKFFPLLVYYKINRRLIYLISNLLNDERTISNSDLDDIDIYHLSFGVVPQQVRKRKAIRILHTICDLIPVLYPHFFKNRNQYFKRMVSEIRQDDWIICISNSTKNDLCNYRKDLDPSRVFVTYLAASKNFHKCDSIEAIERVRNKYGIPDVPYILSIGTLEPRKNIDFLINGFVKLVRDVMVEDLHLVLTGVRGWDYERITNSLSSSGPIRTRIILTGYVDDEDLAPLYSGSLVFVYPSLYEGFGLPLLEAMQCGTPVIASSTSSLPEVVGDAGILVDPADSDSLCQNILNIYRDERLRNILSNKSLVQARKYSWKKCVNETIEVYRTALENKE